MIQLTIPMSAEQILALKVGEAVQLSGPAMTGRDAAHKYMVETLIEGPRPLSAADQALYDELQAVMRGGAIYHSGPIVSCRDGRWRIVSSGPTTSIREEIYQDKIIAAFGVRAVIGKGGMGPRTLAACRRHQAVYLHGIGGAGVFNAAAMIEVIDVFKKEEFGLPEAFWKVRFRDFTAIVTMDAHGHSLHADLTRTFDENLKTLIYGEEQSR